MVTVTLVFHIQWSEHIGLMYQQIPGKASGLNLALKDCFKFARQRKGKDVLIRRSICTLSVKVNKLVTKSKHSNKRKMLDNTI